MPKLIIKNGPVSGEEFEINGDIVVGRGTMTDIVIIDPTISRRHAMVALADDRYVVSDLQSGNGTRVNGMAIHEPTPLRDGDEVQFGNIRADFLWQDDKKSKELNETIVKIQEAEDKGKTKQQVERMDAGDPAASLVIQPTEEIHRDDMDALLEMSKRLQVIYDVGKAITTTLDEDKLMNLIMDKLFEVFAQANRGFIMLYDPKDGQLTPKVARNKKGEATEITVSRTLVKEAIDSRQGILSKDAMDDDRYSMAQSIAQFKIHSVICVPMVADDLVLGVLHIDADDPLHPFDKDDMALLLGIAGQAALSLANTRLHTRLLKQELLEQDLALATRIQLRFLPDQPPDVDGYTFVDDYSAALEVGGDYYDFLELPNGNIGIALGDVSGKGVSAALYMAKLSSDVRFHSASNSEPGEIITKLNASLTKDVEEGMFVTLVYMALNPQTRELTYTSAGHLPTLVRRESGEIISLEEAGDIPLGIEDDTEFSQATFQLQEGDTVVTFTDGVIEATDPDHEQFDDARVLVSLKESDGTPEGVKEKLLSDVKEFIRGAPPNDDLTLICFGPAIPELEFG
jgi:serine phosphatase RsbU (regulator of sigma subunit)